MKNSFRKELQTLQDISNRFEPEVIDQKTICLKKLQLIPLPVNQSLLQYLETLLYLLAYPADPTQFALAEKETGRISRHLKTHQHRKISSLENTGLPYTDTVYRFSHDAIRWLLSHPHCTVDLEELRNSTFQLNDVLQLTLPSLEKSETTAGFTNEELMEVLKVPVKNRLTFLIQEMARLDYLPFIKDLLFDRLKVSVRVIPHDKRYSISHNRVKASKIFFHTEIRKRFDIQGILQQPVPACLAVTSAEKREFVQAIKNSMTLMMKETNPITYMDENSLRIYPLERGIMVAIYGLIPSRQLPLESYVGYTAFKNGLPLAYGGGWVFGERSNFGINVFPPYRNGESAFLLAQLLRVYRHAFKVNYFEVEPFQFGLDNPEGIASGAFWFYYKFGFRPLDKPLLKLAKQEAEKARLKKSYRTPVKTLLAFTNSNVALKLGKSTPPLLPVIATRVTRMIQTRYHGNRMAAESDCRQQFLKMTGMKTFLNEAEDRVFTEVSLWAEAMHIQNNKLLQLLVEMIREKPKGPYAYQDLLIRFFQANK